MQKIKTEEELKKEELLNNIKEALAYLNVNNNISQFKIFPNEKLEEILNTFYQLIATNKGLTDEMFKNFVYNDYSQTRRQIILKTLLSKEPFDAELLKVCLIDGVEDLDVIKIYSEIVSAKETAEHLRKSNKPNYTMSFEQQQELPSDEENEKIISSILKNRYTEINKKLQDVVTNAYKKGLTK